MKGAVIHKKFIRGYDVEIKHFERNGKKYSHGWVNMHQWKGSLSLLAETGCVELGNKIKTVDKKAKEEIMEWAETVGYKF